MESDDAVSVSASESMGGIEELHEMCLGQCSQGRGAGPFLAQGTQTIPMGTDVSRLPSFHHRYGLRGRPETSPVRKAGTLFPEPQSLHAWDWEGCYPRFASPLTALDWFL